jgi:hypothetical protein
VRACHKASLASSTQLEELDRFDDEQSGSVRVGGFEAASSPLNGRFRPSEPSTRPGARRSLCREGRGHQGPTGTDMLTRASAGSRRARRSAAAAYPGPDGGRLLAVGSERPAQGPEMAKASVGRVQVERSGARHSTRDAPEG